MEILEMPTSMHSLMSCYIVILDQNLEKVEGINHSHPKSTILLEVILDARNTYMI